MKMQDAMQLAMENPGLKIRPVCWRTDRDRLAWREHSHYWLEYGVSASIFAPGLFFYMSRDGSMDDIGVRHHEEVFGDWEVIK